MNIQDINQFKLSDENIARQVIKGEIQGLQDLLSEINQNFTNIIDEIYAITGRVIVSGMGKSGHIARKIAATLASTGTPAIYIHPAEAGHGDLGMITVNDIVILLSNSGETPELAPIIDYCKRFSIKIIGISRKKCSTLSNAAFIPVVLPATPEACDIMAPTTSAVMMMAYGDAIAVALYKRRGFTDSDYRVFHPGGNIGAKLLRLKDLMHKDKEIPLINYNETAFEAILTMTSRRLGCVGVLNEVGLLMGIITDGDLRRNMDLNFKQTKVTMVMTADPITLHEDKLASEALGIMNLKSITVIFIVNDENKPVGVIHIHDLLRAGVV
ncbi:putative phosphosugar isomerase [Candidatus Jidaibacter acanthamoeba]|uniref:Putative phosphosugar isomerase n=1 Tax=Candidatus Jidaibacter acanthamoebae TaxID=86105 RepID=A0A0C1QG25_9RICK|nr:KpsF/GutQ family sugar-phosphate isomerase [Candidatus Jidaibacter acanthamoeba]KIE04504.1 putative phosphosugar isomerase [Candidatus Jidaibacter acanthamoeba]